MIDENLFAVKRVLLEKPPATLVIRSDTARWRRSCLNSETSVPFFFLRKMGGNVILGKIFQTREEDRHVTFETEKR